MDEGKNLTLKSLEKQVREQNFEILELIDKLTRRIEIIEKSLRR